MKTIKHLFAALLLLCATVVSAHDFEVNGIYYTITDITNKTVAVTYKGTSYSTYSNEYSGCVVIPESVTDNGTTYSVTSIGHSAFEDCSGLTSIEISNSVTSIGHSAFEDCSGLTSIAIPNSVTSIESSAFRNCTGLASVVIPNSVTSIGYYAFYGCSGLTSVEFNAENCTTMGSSSVPVFDCCTSLTTVRIGEDVKNIPNSAFYGCSALSCIVIPDGVVSIGDYAFYGCSGLTSIVIPNSVTSIGNCAFYYCQIAIVVNFSNLTFSKGSYSYGEIARRAIMVINASNGLISGDFAWFENNGVNTLACYLGNVTELTLPNDYNGKNYVIGNYAFYGCSSLTNLTIGNSVTSIGTSAFSGCSGLTSIEIPNSVTGIGGSAFYNCTNLASVVIGDSVTSIGDWAFYGCTELTSVEIGNSVTSIGDYAFYNCTSLASVVIGNSVTSIGESAFRNCTGLTSVEIPNSVTSIGESAFYNCTSLASVVIGDSVASIGDDAFRKCTDLTNLIIGKSVTNIGDYAFYDCSGLKTVINFSILTFSKGSSNYGYVAYYADKVINAPNGFIESDYAFGIVDGVNTLVAYLGADSEINLPADYKGENYVIGNEAFKNNETLTSVTVPDGVTSIGKEAFYGCASLKDLNIGKRTVSIDEYAFYGCSSLENLKIGDGVKSIEKYAFYNCANLKNIVLGKRVNYIGDYAFATSNKIETIYALPTRAINCENTTTAFHQNAYKYATLYVKEGSIDSYETTEPWSKFYIEPIGDFTLTYIVDGEVYKKEKYEYDSAITPLDMPEKEGYTFSGWSEIPETMPAYDVTVTGYYNINSYNLTYMIDGEVYYTTTVEYGAVVPEIENPSREGHTFGGWSEVPATMPAEDVVIEGSFTVNSYNVIYIVDGEEYKRESVAYGAAITLPEEPIKEGHTFCGWSDMPETMPAHDVTVTGSYTINSYNLTYMVDGEVYYTTVVEFGATISEIEAPNKKGYTFSGWDDVPEVMPANDVVVNGSFSVNSYMVFFMVDDAVYHMATVKYEDKIELPSSPVKEGYIFSHWDGLPEIMPAENVVVHAVFDEDTAIDEVEIEDGKVNTVYDLQGRVVENPSNGIYIINGKKVLVK